MPFRARASRSKTIQLRNAVVTAAKNASPRPFFARAGVPFSKAADGRRNVTQPWEYTDVDDHSGLLRMEYDVADGLTVFGSAGASHSNVERYLASATTITSVLGTTSTSPQFYHLQSRARAGNHTSAHRAASAAFSEVVQMPEERPNSVSLATASASS